MASQVEIGRLIREESPEGDPTASGVCADCGSFRDLVPSDGVDATTRACLAFCGLCSLDPTVCVVVDRSEQHGAGECWGPA